VERNQGHGPATVAKIKRVRGTWPSSMESQRLGGPAAACVGLAAIVSQGRAWLNLDRYQTLPL